MQKSKNILLLLLVGFVVMACQNVTRPAGVLSAGDFEDVLYDIHLSHYMTLERKAGDTLSDASHRYALTLDVLKKHDVTQAEWDSSMVYYTRHSPELKEIYDDLFDRLSVVGEGVGASVGDGAADSSNIWQADRQIMLTSQRGFTTMQWTIKADTLVQPGEKLNFEYLALFLNNQAQSRLMAVLTIRLKNDSVIVRNQVCGQTGIYTLTIEDDQKIGIKSISGYFMLMQSQQAMFGNVEDSRQTNKNQIVALSDIRLTHQSANAPSPTNGTGNANDTIQSQSPDNHSAPPGAPTPPPTRPDGTLMPDRSGNGVPPPPPSSMPRI